MNIDGQMTIYDFIYPPDDLPDLEEAVNLVAKKYGIKFKKIHNKSDAPEDDLVYYTGKYRNLIIELDDNTYWDSGKRFIGLDINYSKGGCGLPCDSMEEIFEHIDRNIKKYAAKG
jgi:hypothetical protein